MWLFDKVVLLGSHYVNQSGGIAYLKIKPSSHPPILAASGASLSREADQSTGIAT